MTLYPDALPGSLVVYETENTGLITTANARVTRAYSGGFVDLAYFPEGLDAKTAQGDELMIPVVGVTYASDGRPQTWHLPE